MRVMNENLNLVEILKNCPKGMKIDCTMWDNVTFDGIIENRLYPIKVNVGDGPIISLTKYGQYTDDDYAKCIIFPKGKTTWEGFVPPHKFKDGDIVATNTGNWIGITAGGHAHSYMPTYCVLSHNREVKLYFSRKNNWDLVDLPQKEKSKNSSKQSRIKDINGMPKQRPWRSWLNQSLTRRHCTLLTECW